jgi:pyrimidine-nucleoside phosphorylase
MSQHYSAYNIIQKKRDGGVLTTEEIGWIIDQLVEEKLPHYQMSALLMAIYFKGLNQRETADLTNAMLYSGERLQFEDQSIIDKHSTGGVGDKTSFIIAPLARACGVKVPMVAGRGLGHTGGTIDKIEAIKGFKTSLTLQKFEQALKERGVVLMGQTASIAPADGIIYSLRDVTATIDSIPLITASIMSKKLAEGASGIVMDVKVGKGAFMTNKTKARALAKSLAQTAQRFDKSMVTMITDMNQPLGDAVGNSIELIECFEVLKGRGPKDLIKLSLELAGAMIFLGGKAKSLSAGIKKAKAALNDGSGLKELKKLIKDQGGNPKVVDNYDLLPMAKKTFDIVAPKAGYIKMIHARQIGLHCVALGGGRAKKEDKIDFGVGFMVHKKVGDKVKKGEALITVYYNKNQQSLVEEISNTIITKDIKLSAAKVDKIPLIYETKVYGSKS